MALTARLEATSPALWPPMPSATTKRPRSGSTRNASSFVVRRPGWVTPWAASDMGHDYSSIGLYTLYTPGRADPSASPHTRPRECRAGTWPGCRRVASPDSPVPVRIAQSRRRTHGSKRARRSLAPAGRLAAGDDGIGPAAGHVAGAHLRCAVVDTVASARPHCPREGRAVSCDRTPLTRLE